MSCVEIASFLAMTRWGYDGGVAGNDGNAVWKMANFFYVLCRDCFVPRNDVVGNVRRDFCVLCLLHPLYQSKHRTKRNARFGGDSADG